MSTIVIVDDEPQTRALVANSLSSHGFAVHTVGGGGELDQVLQRTRVDLVLLDIMMPGEDGLSICRRIANAAGPAVILLSALNEEQDRIVGLEVGADHYLPKPCSPREILATVRAALRRRRHDHQFQRRGILTFAGWKIDLDAHQLFDRDGALIDLTDGEFAVLRVFAERSRRVLSREALLEAARGPDTDSFDRAIDVQVSRLRRKLDGNREDLIRTIRNEGYLFTPKVEPG